MEGIFQTFEMLYAKIASAVNMIIQNSQFKKKVSLEEQKAQEGGPVPTRKTDRLHDLSTAFESLARMTQY